MRTGIDKKKTLEGGGKGHQSYAPRNAHVFALQTHCAPCLTQNAGSSPPFMGLSSAGARAPLLARLLACERAKARAVWRKNPVTFYVAIETKKLSFG